jgi:outer membrane biosynthesis protein TonB
MDRAEATGFGIALLGHAALFAALSLGFAAAVKAPILNDPMEVSFVEETGLQSAAETPAAEAPAAPPSAVETLPDVAPPLPRTVTAPPPPSVAPTPTPRVAPRRPAAPAQAAPQQQLPARRTNRLTGLLNGVGEAESQSPSATPRAAISGAARSSLSAEVRRQLKPHWKAPTGADAELLRTELEIALAPNGNVISIDIVRTTGQTASNRPQVKLHQEQAVKAVRLASPFRLPPEFYDSWKQITTSFDKRLSQ